MLFKKRIFCVQLLGYSSIFVIDEYTVRHA